MFRGFQLNLNCQGHEAFLSTTLLSISSQRNSPFLFDLPKGNK